MSNFRNSFQSDVCSYWSFIWTDRINRKRLFFGIVLTIIQFVIFKLLYPFPDVFWDSSWYILAASRHLDINIWPIGYSKFLDVFHHLTSSATALVAFQYGVMQLATFHFYYTVIYFFKIDRFTKNVLFFFFCINPLTLYLSNTVASDTLFGALSLSWLTDLVWTIKKPALHHLLFQSVLFFCCFTLRNTAYYYPFVALTAYLLSYQPIWRKVAGAIVPILLIIPFILHTDDVAYKVTGTRQFSFLTGWQLANNVFYIYEHLNVDSNQLPVGETRKINQLALDFIRKPDSIKNAFYDYNDGNAFIVQAQSPLSNYFDLHRVRYKNSTMGEAWYQMCLDWGKTSALLEPFGKSVILHHPVGYIRFFVLPNSWNYFVPSLSDLSTFHYGTAKLLPFEKDWFKYTTNRVSCVSFYAQSHLFGYSLIFLLLNISFLIESIIILLKHKYFEISKLEYRIYILMLTYISLNFLFSICVTINILRYQYIPMFILFTSCLFLRGKILRLKNKRKPELILVNQ